jgi:hypothetical protein
MNCWGHQKEETIAVWGNWKVDREAKWAALTEGQTSAALTAALFPCPLTEVYPWYTSQEQAWFETEGGSFLPGGGWKFANNHIAIPQSLTPTFVKQFHGGTHSQQTALKTTLTQHFYVPKLSNISKTVCERCSLCAKNNPWQRPRTPPQVQNIGGTPFENLIVDFTEMPWARAGNICWCLSAPSQDWWKPSLFGLRKPGKWPGAC